MSHGLARFTLFLDRFETLLIEAAKQSDAALYLYQNGARTPLFMLEGLSKLYSGLHDEKKFEKLEERFKQLEDAIGAIDYYDNFAKEFGKDNKIPPDVTKFVADKASEKLRLLNRLLVDENWMCEKADRLDKIREKLADVDWLTEKAEIRALESYYRESIDKINAFAAEYTRGFTELETQVHELRRKLRWLSIYPQALQGAIQLRDTGSNDPDLTKYLTTEIVNSPFNKMPDASANRYVLELDRDRFLALSWMIAELGKLKDEGLRIEVLKEAGHPPIDAHKTETTILSKAFSITRAFFAERNLDRLIVGTAERESGD